MISLQFTAFDLSAKFRKTRVVRLASILVLAGCASIAGAADDASSAETSRDAGDALPHLPYAVSADAGTLGFGGSFAWRFSDHWGVRAGVDYLSLTDTGVEAGDLHYTGTLRLLSEPLTLDIYPWRKRSFRVSIGLLMNQNQFTGTADDGFITIDGQIITINDLGQLDARIVQQPVNPYLSIGGNLFYFDRAHRWALGGELGIVYTGNPEVTLTRSGPPSQLLDRAVARAQGELNDYAEKFTWWPVAKIQVTYSF